MRIAVLGPLAMWAADGSPLDVRGVRLRGLLARLALDAGKPVGVETLVDGLWDRSQAPSANALQSLVSRLRAGLPVTESAVSVQSGPAGYMLTLDPECVDALQFEELVRRGRGLLRSDAERAMTLLGQAEKLWRGEALTDLRELPFAGAEADRLAELRLAATEDFAAAALGAGRARELIADLETMAAAHPLRERLHELLIRALSADGRQAEALTAYERVRETLAEELGTDPGTRLRELQVAVLRGDSVDPAPSQSVVVPARPHSNLRAPMTSFVGRSTDVAELNRLLGDGTRLVTMVGPGGAGKTRLATETARTLMQSSGDGIWLVELAPLGDAAEVAPAVLAALGASEYVDQVRTTLVPGHLPTSRAATERLTEVIADRQVLLVLDNCEHLVQEVAGLVDSLLATCPRLRVLATSREPLSIPGEHLHPVGPLGLPPEERTAAGTSTVADELGMGTPGAAAGAGRPGVEGPAGEVGVEYPAVQLFVDRARAVRPEFAVTGANRAAIGEICRRLDGMPLAIELAAARLRALTPVQIVERLEDRFRLLTSGSRTALPRHQTLRAVVEWSWDLLDPDEQAVARRLSLFSGGASLEAAEAVCSDQDLPSEAVLGILASLVDKSLVEAAADERSVRYRMLETVKAYGAEQLAGEAERFRVAHRDYFHQLLRQARPKLFTGDQLVWLSRLDVESENVLAALRTSMDLGDSATTMAMTAVLGEYWILRGRPAETVAWLEQALAVPGPSDPQDRAGSLLMYSLGTLSHGEDPGTNVFGAVRGLAQVRQLARRDPAVTASGIGRFTNAAWAMIRRDSAGCFRELDAARDHPDPWTRNMAVMMTAMFYENEGWVDEMITGLDTALAGFRALGDRWGAALALRGIAGYHSARGEHTASVAAIDEALRLVGELGTTDGAAGLLTWRAGSRLELGDFAGCRDDLYQAVRLAEETGSRSSQGIAMAVLADLARREGRLDEALEQAEAAYRQLDPVAEQVAPHGQALVLAARCRAHLARGETEAAVETSALMINLALATEDMPVVSMIVEVAADVARRTGAPDLAARTLGLAAALRGMRTIPTADVQATVDHLRSTLGHATYQSTYDEAAALPRGEALIELRKHLTPA